ncbi:hypothetical protein EEX84_03880 [Planococcus salinus]|uniref:Uncharacterized protein n=1 Tax=Planococcus salinus TaxID=1848460 RepID=A0A3M8PB70_9BACL|nr:hypothetical protein EEX84_03880 [Planococcus salinus]
MTKNKREIWPKAGWLVERAVKQKLIGSFFLMLCLTSVIVQRPLALFLNVQTPAARLSGHKPTQLCDRKRHFAGSSYARQAYTAACAFLKCPDSSGQALGS